MCEFDKDERRLEVKVNMLPPSLSHPLHGASPDSGVPAARAAMIASMAACSY